MLLELLVENYAVIENLRIRFHPGLNVLTGETGSGKSIVVDALGLLFGARSTAEMIRSGAARARISGIFEPAPEAAAYLASEGIELEDGELLLEREILASGKSRSFASSRPVTVKVLRDLAPYLGDIHGQHDQQRLFSEDEQLDLLDRFAGEQSLLDELSQTFSEWRTCVAELADVDKSAQERLRLLDLWSFQRTEIEAAVLKPGEEEELLAERRVLQNVGKLMESAQTAYEAIYDAPASAHSQLRVVLKKIEELTRIDASLESLRESLASAQVAIEDASTVLRDYAAKLEADPVRLEAVESRLATIEKLKRKYGADVEGILQFLEETRIQIDAAENSSERRASLEKRRAALEEAFTALAERMHKARTVAAKKLSAKVEAELTSLAMERTAFEVRLTRSAWNSTGYDAATFLVSANVGEEPRPLDKVASGGELSRIALALSTCVRGQSDARTLVFDEVDAGIGGSAAESVGKRLKDIAANNQVLCVTHLAQIAGFGDHHYSVEKHEVRGRTVTSIEELLGDARTREIGRMLSGQHLTPEALKHAEQLIRTVARH